MSGGGRLEGFLSLSADLTAYHAFELEGTGQADAFLDTVVSIVGEETVDQMLQAHTRARAEAAGDDGVLERMLRRDLLSDEKLGPVARNVIKLWYVGIWYELPRAWREAFGARANDVTFTVSANAYVEGLLWPTVGANPPGAKAPGYGSWASPPRIPAEDGSH